MQKKGVIHKNHIPTTMSTPSSTPSFADALASLLPAMPPGDSFTQFKWLETQLDGTNGLPRALSGYCGYELQIRHSDDDDCGGRKAGMCFATELEANAIKDSPLGKAIKSNAPSAGYYDPNARMCLYFYVKKCTPVGNCPESRKASGNHKWMPMDYGEYGRYLCCYCDKRKYFN